MSKARFLIGYLSSYERGLAQRGCVAAQQRIAAAHSLRDLANLLSKAIQHSPAADCPGDLARRDRGAVITSPMNRFNLGKSSSLLELMDALIAKSQSILRPLSRGSKQACHSTVIVPLSLGVSIGSANRLVQCLHD